MAESISRFPCESCKYRGSFITPVKYCATCHEHLCKDCVELHKAFKATRNHLLVSCTDENRKTILHDLKSFQMCQEHKNHKTEFYCGDHDVFLCSLCLLRSDVHKNCSAIIDINKTGKTFVENRFAETVENGYRNLVENGMDIINDMKRTKDSNSSKLTTLKVQIESMRRKMMEAFDRQTKHLVNEVLEELQEHVENCEKASGRIEERVHQAKWNEHILKEAIENSSAADVFQCVKSILGQCDEFDKELEQTKKQCSNVNIVIGKSKLATLLETDTSPLFRCTLSKTPFDLKGSFCGELNKDFQSHISEQAIEILRHSKNQTDKAETNEDVKSENMSNFCGDATMTTRYDLGSGRCDAENLCDTGIDSLGADRYNGIKLSYSHRFDVHTSDESEPWFGGIVCLPNDRLILSDYNNSRLIMVENCEVTFEKNTKYKPGSMALINEFLVVCLKEKNQLLFLKIKGNNLEEKFSWQGDHNLKNVKTVDENKLIVSFKSKKNKWYFELLTLNGLRYTRKLLDIELTGIYSGCVFAVHNLPDAKFRVLQWCSESGQLNCFSQDGSKSLFQNKVRDTTSLETDKDGCVFVVCHSGEVQVLNPDGGFITSFQRRTMSRIKYAVLSQDEDMLFITGYKESCIFVLNVERLYKRM